MSTRELLFFDLETNDDVTGLFANADADLGKFVKYFNVRDFVICVYLAAGWRECLTPYKQAMKVELKSEAPHVA